MSHRRSFGILLGLCVGLLITDAALAFGSLAENIAAEPLPQALTALAEQTGLQILYVSDLAQGKTSQAVPKGLDATQALRRLLEGSGLTFERLNERAVRLRVLPAPRAPHNTEPALDEVVVVANSREQRLQAVPISARVIDSAELAPFGLRSVDQVLTAVPGVQYSASPQWGAGLYNRLAMRGVVADGASSTTVVYFDDTSLYAALTPHSAFTIPYPVIFDLDRIEVLRGPQGVEFGAGAEGGAVRFIPKRASVSESFETYTAELGTIEHGGRVSELSAVVGQPIIPNVLGVRVGFETSEEGGFIDRINPFTGTIVDPNSNRSTRRVARLSLAYEPSDSFVILPSFTYQVSRLHDTATYYQAFSNPAKGVFQNGKLMTQPYEDELLMGSLKVERRWPAITLTSVTSYLKRTDHAVIDVTNEAGVFYLDGYGSPAGPEVPVSYMDAVTDQAQAHVRMFAQEARLASNDPSRRAVWSAGLYFADYVRTQSDEYYVVPAPRVAAIAEHDWDHTTELSAFGQVRYALTSHWKLGAGVRVGAYRMKGTALSGGFLQSGGDSLSTLRNHDGLPRTPRLDLTYEANPQLMLYGAASRGARVGRGEGQIYTCDGERTQAYYGTDSLWNYELGAKGSLWHQNISYQASVYDIEWHDVQLKTYDPCAQAYMTNAGNVVSRGFELSVGATLSDRWRLTGHVGLVDARARSTVYGLGGLLVAERGATVAGLPNVPAPWSGTLTAEYVWPLSAETKAVFRSRWLLTSHHPGPFPELNPRFPTYDPRQAADPATQQWNISAALLKQQLDVNLYVDNVLNQHPTLQISGDAPGTPIIYAYTLRPRTIGLSVVWHR